MNIISIRDVLNPNRLVMMSPDGTLGDALDLMEQRRLTVLAVAKRGHLHGLLCVRDIIRHVSQHGGLHTTPVSRAMTRDVRWVETRASLCEAQALMRRHGVSHAPVMDLSGRLVGILHRSDIPDVRAVAAADHSAPRPVPAAAN